MLVQVRRVLLAVAALVAMAPAIALASPHHGPGPRPPTPPVQPPAAVQQQMLQQQIQRSAPEATSAGRTPAIAGYPAESALAGSVNSWRDFGSLSDEELIVLFREMGLDLASGSGLSGGELVGSIKRQALAEGATPEQLAAIDAMLQTSGPALAATIDRIQDGAPSAFAQAFRDEYAKTCMCDAAAFATALGKAETRVIQNGEAAMLVSMGMPSDVAVSMASTTIEYGRNDDEIRYAGSIVGARGETTVASVPPAIESGGTTDFSSPPSRDPIADTSVGPSPVTRDTVEVPMELPPGGGAVAVPVPPTGGGGGGGGGEGGVPETPAPVAFDIPGPVDLGPLPIGEPEAIIPDRSVDPSPATREVLDPVPADPPAETVVADLARDTGGGGKEDGSAETVGVAIEYDWQRDLPECGGGDSECRARRNKIIDDALDRKIKELNDLSSQYAELVDEGERNAAEIRQQLTAMENEQIFEDNRFWNSWWMSGIIDYGGAVIDIAKVGVTVAACTIGPAVCAGVLAVDEVGGRLEALGAGAGEYSAEMTYGTGDQRTAIGKGLAGSANKFLESAAGDAIGSKVGNKAKSWTMDKVADKVGDFAVESLGKLGAITSKSVDAAEYAIGKALKFADKTIGSMVKEGTGAVAGWFAKTAGTASGATGAMSGKVESRAVYLTTGGTP